MNDRNATPEEIALVEQVFEEARARSREADETGQPLYPSAGIDEPDPFVERRAAELEISHLLWKRAP